VRRIFTVQLHIADDDLLDYTWSQIVDKLKELTTLSSTSAASAAAASPVQLNMLNMNSIICRNDNFLIALLRTNNIMCLANKYVFNSILEWSLLFSVVGPLKYLDTNISSPTLQSELYASIYNHNHLTQHAYPMTAITTTPVAATLDANITEPHNLLEPLLQPTTSVYGMDIANSDAHSHTEEHPQMELQWQEYYDVVSYRFNLIIFINILAIPFSIMIVLAYMILNNGARIYYTPKLIFDSQLARYYKWTLRYYNELPHNYQQRQSYITALFATYTKHVYSNRIFTSISSIVIFLLSSCFVILLSLSFIAPDFINLNVYDDKNILWCIGFIGSILVIHNTKDTKDITPSSAAVAVASNAGAGSNIQSNTENLKSELHAILLSLHPEPQTTSTHKLILRTFISNIKYITYELLTIVFMPYILWSIKRNICATQQIQNLIHIDSHLGVLCKFGCFNNTNILHSDLHTLLSFNNFKSIFPADTQHITLDWNNTLVRKLRLHS
jgi:hypothetical protein